MGLPSLPQSDRARVALGLGGLLLAIGTWRAGLLPPPLSAVMANVANSGLSQRDIERETQNYYEVLLDVGYQRWTRGTLAGLISGLLRDGTRSEEGGNWVPIAASDLIVSDPDSFLGYELKPDYETVYMGVPVRTNRWGMRDRDYEQAKPPGTFRIALVGSSNDMAYGVEVQDGYADLLEDRLNAELGGPGRPRYEVLNFSVGGYELLHRLHVTDTKVPAFHPDLIVVVATMHDLRWSAYELLVKRLRADRDLHYDFLRRFVAEAGAEPGQTQIRLRRKLRPRRESLVRAVFEELRRIGERERVPVVLANLRLRVDPIHPEMLQQTRLAREAGLLTLEIFDAYEGRTDSEMYLTPTDSHPTVVAHALLADELYRDLRADETIEALLLGRAQARTEVPHAPRR